MIEAGAPIIAGNIITAVCCSTATLDGSQLVFDTRNLPASAITLGGSTTIFADPPAASPSATLPISDSTANSPQHLLNLDLLSQPHPSNSSGLSLPASSNDSIHTIPLAPPLSGFTILPILQQAPTDTEASDIEPVAFIDRSSLTKQSIDSLLASIPGALIKRSSDCILTNTSQQSACLLSGEALVSTSRNMVVNVGPLHILVAAGTTATISQIAGVAIVRNLCDNHSGSLNIMNGDKLLCTLKPGEEIMFGHPVKVSATLENDKTSRRNSNSILAGKDHIIMHSEFSFPSLVLNSPTVSDLLHDKHKETRQLGERLVKSAACLSLVTQGHGNFTRTSR
jgi:hypothetical protein